MTLLNIPGAHIVPGSSGVLDMSIAMRLLGVGFWHAPEPGNDRPCVGRRWIKAHPYGENHYAYNEAR
jgi:hypothetical protein